MKKGGKISDILKDPIGWAKEVAEPIPTKLNNVSTDTLKWLGHLVIDSPIQIVRTPLSKIWTTALNTLSLGKFDELKDKHELNKLFHVGLLVSVGNTKVIIEKNEVVNVSDKWQGAVNAKTEYYNIYFDKLYTLNGMLDNTIKQMGPELFYSYDALRGNNCQNFIENILSSNKLLTKQSHDFLFQNIAPITKDLEKSEVSYVPDAVRYVTDMGSKVSRLIGKGRGGTHPRGTSSAMHGGKQDKRVEVFIKFVKNGGYRFL